MADYALFMGWNRPVIGRRPQTPLRIKQDWNLTTNDHIKIGSEGESHLQRHRDTTVGNGQHHRRPVNIMVQVGRQLPAGIAPVLKNSASSGKMANGSPP